MSELLNTIIAWFTQDTAHILYGIFLIAMLIAIVANVRLEIAKYKAGYYKTDRGNK